MRAPSLVCLSATVCIERGRNPRSCNQRLKLASLAIGGKGHRGPFVYSVQWGSARHNPGQALSVLLAEFPLDKRLVLESREKPDSWFREWPKWQAKWLLKVTLPWKWMSLALFCFPSTREYLILSASQRQGQASYWPQLSKRWKHIPLLHHVPNHRLSSASLSGSVSSQQEIW